MYYFGKGEAPVPYRKCGKAWTGQVVTQTYGRVLYFDRQLVQVTLVGTGETRVTLVISEDGSADYRFRFHVAS